MMVVSFCLGGMTAMAFALAVKAVRTKRQRSSFMSSIVEQDNWFY